MLRVSVFLCLVCIVFAGMAAADVTVTFQQGVSDYSDAVDTYVDSGSAGSSYGTSELRLNSGGRQGLLRFGNIIGEGLIPSGVFIKSATLTICGHTTSSAGGGTFHRLLSSATTDGWSGSSTWNSLVSGINQADTEYAATATASFATAPTNQTPVNINVTADVQAWAGGATNLGWVIFGNSVTQYLWSSEAADPTKRPLLTVTYTLLDVAFSVRDQTSASTIWTDSPTVDVTISAQPIAPAEVIGYLVTETAATPALDAAWQDPLLAYTITGSQGLVTLYGWAKDSADRIAGKSVVIAYTSTLPMISNITLRSTATTITVSWTTDVPCFGWVAYGAFGGSLDQTTSPASSGTSHTAVISGLTGTTRYDLQIHANDTTTSSVITWWTLGRVVTWDGNGVVNNDGSWNNALNWDINEVPLATDAVVIPSVTAFSAIGNAVTNTRIITTIGPVACDDLRLAQSDATYYNRISIGGDLTIRKCTNSVAEGNTSRISLYMNGRTLTFEEWSGQMLHPTSTADDGSKIVKTGTTSASANFNGGLPYYGDFVVNEGQLSMGLCNARMSTVNIIVNAGRFVYTDDRESGTPPLRPKSWTLNGMGTDNNGAMHATWFNVNPHQYTGEVKLPTDGSISLASGLTMTLKGKVTGNGGLTKFDAGTLILDGTNEYLGTTVAAGGKLQVNKPVLGPAVVKDKAILLGPPMMFPEGIDSVTVEEGGFWDYGPNSWFADGDSNNNGGADYSGEFIVEQGRLNLSVCNMNLGNASFTVNDGATTCYTDDRDVHPKSWTLNGDGVDGAGALTATWFNGPHIYTGTFNIASDASVSLPTGLNLDLWGAVSGPGVLTKKGAGKLTVTTTTAIPGVSMAQGIIGGTGKVGGLLTMQDATTLAPGTTAAGKLSAENATIGAIVYEFHINDADGAEGVNWDTLHVDEMMTLTATQANPVTFKLLSLTAANQPGLLPNFSNTKSYSWTVARGLYIEGFNSKAFSIDTSLFYNEPGMRGWSVVRAGNELRLIFGVALEGDVNDDCRVNILDLIAVRNRLNMDINTGDNWRYDVNGDGRINILDLIYIRNRLNSVCGS